ncbi:MAG: ABC transporter ATP-binding protein, partial [Chloroflexi bacterium]|nr:ABC transporter ATP-binding protein [Chloroflexota bacterium]
FDLAEAPEAARRSVGLISHQPLLYEDLSAEENLHFYGTLYDVPELASRVATLLQQVGLSARRHSLVHTFSRGMKQRLAIARALLHDPPVLLLDEPYTGLDQQASDMLTHLLEGVGANSRTVVLTTHDVRQGLRLCRRALLLVDGEVVYQTHTEEDKETFEQVYRQYLVMREGLP